MRLVPEESPSNGSNYAVELSADLLPGVADPDSFDPEQKRYPPGFYGNMRKRLPVFALAGTVSVLAGLIPFPYERKGVVLAAGGLFFSLTAVAVLLPWRKLPFWCWSIVPVAYVGVVALLTDAQGGFSSGMAVLYFLPLIWLSLYGDRSHLAVGLGAVFLSLVVPILTIGRPQYPPQDWRFVVMVMAVAPLLSYTILAMVARDRRQVSGLQRFANTAKLKAADALDARRQLDSLFRAATGTSIIGTDDEGLVTFFSPGAENLLGYTRDDVVGVRYAWEFLEPGELRTRADEILALASAATRGVPVPDIGVESIWTYLRSDGTARKCSVVLTVRQDEGVPIGYVIVATDVTERESLARERERLFLVQREVAEVLTEQNNRLHEFTQMKDDLVATVSHELRTPLTSIRGYVDLLLEDADELTDEHLAMVRTIERNSEQLITVAEDLLADPGGSQLHRLNFVETNLTDLVRESVDSIVTVASSRSVQLTFLPEATMQVRADPKRIRQLVDNLLANAVKFVSKGGHVEVRMGEFGHFARIEVLDDGPGIPLAERSQLFERFYRLASADSAGVPGSGLGLAIAKSVVDAHTGYLDIVDTPGWSTTFRVLLPLIPPADHAKEDVKSALSRALPAPQRSQPYETRAS
ncbi:MAG: sensor histidine kinase [Acidimicrobiales bacterium]|jgi:PAS domain S-box-containing protein